MNKQLYKILLIRHGESIWNHSSKFTGWTNIPLTEDGRKEAFVISKKLIEYNLIPDVFFSSVLDRCTETSKIIKQNINPTGIIYTSWRLNEKHYGTLEGTTRNYIREEYGEKFTSMMRNNFYMKPPVLNNLPNLNTNYSIFKNCYFDKIKNGESKENVLRRLLPYFENDILYTITENKLPLIVTHKHCLRVLMKHYLNITDELFETYTIPKNNILVMYFDDNFTFNKYEYINY